MAWRTRIWGLALAPVALSVAAPWILLAVFSGRLPDRAYIDGWSRVGPEYADLAPTWQDWADNYFYFGIAAGLVVTALVAWRRVPRLQRWVVAWSWGFSAQVVGGLIIHVTAVVDVPGYSVPPSPWWTDIASVAIGLAAAGVVWVLVGRLPSNPAAKGGLPSWVLRRHLGPTERVVFFESMVSRRTVALGCVIAAVAVVLSSAAFAVLGIAYLLVTRAKVQIDGEGVLLELPLLRIRQRVPYREIEYGEVADRSYTSRWSPLLEDAQRFGYVGQRANHMVLHLTDKREFVVGLRGAVSAVALVNGEISRRRELAC